MLYCSDMSVLHVIHGIECLKQNQHGAHGSPAPTLIVTSVSCHLVEMISPEMWLCVNGHFSGWLCVGSVSPVLTWVWFIIPSKPWVGQRPGEMEGTSTTGAFLTLVTVKRKGYTSKHFSRPRFFFIQHCITFFFFFSPHIQEETPVTPPLMSRLFPSLMIYSLVFFSTDLRAPHVNPFLFRSAHLLGLDRYVGWE